MPLLNDVRHYEIRNGLLIADIARYATDSGITPDLYVERVLQRLMDLHCLSPERLGGLLTLDCDSDGRR